VVARWWRRRGLKRTRGLQREVSSILRSEGRGSSRAEHLTGRQQPGHETAASAAAAAEEEAAAAEEEAAAAQRPRRRSVGGAELGGSSERRRLAELRAEVGRCLRPRGAGLLFGPPAAAARGGAFVAGQEQLDFAGGPGGAVADGDELLSLGEFRAGLRAAGVHLGEEDAPLLAHLFEAAAPCDEAGRVSWRTLLVSAIHISPPRSAPHQLLSRCTAPRPTHFWPFLETGR
jgi:hypothetical protein